MMQESDEKNEILGATKKNLTFIPIVSSQAERVLGSIMVYPDLCYKKIHALPEH